jgi:hypothetical protein
MPRGDKSSYTDKQKRQAEHIEEGYEHRGVSKKEAERRAWATVNAETHGGKKSGSGRGTKETTPRPARAANSAEGLPLNARRQSVLDRQRRQHGPANDIQLRSAIWAIAKPAETHTTRRFRSS